MNPSPGTASDGHCAHNVPDAHPPLGGIPGLDAVEGLRLALGREALYRRLLTRFVEGQAGVLGQVARAQAQGDTVAAIRAAHTLKGTAAQIGAPALQEAARQWEAALQAGWSGAELAQAESRVAGLLGPLVRALCETLGLPVPEATAPRG